MTSRDGVTWTPAAGIPGIHEFWSVTYGNGIFVATGIEYTNNYATQTNVIATSQDGINWTKTSVQSAKSLQVAFGDGVFVAVSDKGDTDSTQQILTSSDGMTWARHADLSGSQKWTKIAYCDGKFMAVSTEFDVIASDDGTTWTPQTSPTYGFTPQASDSNAMVLACGNGKFVLLSSVNNGANMNQALVATHVFTDAGTSMPVSIVERSEAWLVLSFDGNSFIGTYGNNSLVSQNGADWTTSGIAHGPRWMGLTFAHGLYVAVDDGGQIMTSGTYAPPIEETPSVQAPANNESVITTTTTATATKVTKQNTLPETGSNSSTLALLAGVLIAGGAVIALRRRIVS